MTRVCLNCRFFAPPTIAADTGDCRRYAPSLSKVMPQDHLHDVGARRIWPAVCYDDWCGEWVFGDADPNPDEERRREEEAQDAAHRAYTEP